MYGKRGVHKDSRLQERGGYILEKDGLIYNCALTRCDIGWDINESLSLSLLDGLILKFFSTLYVCVFLPSVYCNLFEVQCVRENREREGKSCVRA